MNRHYNKSPIIQMGGGGATLICSNQFSSSHRKFPCHTQASKLPLEAVSAAALSLCVVCVELEGPYSTWAIRLGVAGGNRQVLLRTKRGKKGIAGIDVMYLKRRSDMWYHLTAEERRYDNWYKCRPYSMK